MAKLSGLLLAVFALIWLPTKYNGQIVGPAGDLGDDLWDQNNFFKDINKAARTLNSTNCWICMHVPGNGRGGLTLHAVPLNMTGLSNIDTSQWAHSPTGKVFVSLREPASVCIRRNHTSSSTTSTLGHWTVCNSIIDMPITCSNHSISSSYIKLNWLSMEQYQFCSFVEGIVNWTRNQNHKSFAMPDDTWFLCGKHAYREVPYDWSGTCTLGVVIPVIYSMQKLPNTRIRNKRDIMKEQPLTLGGSLKTQISRGILPNLGAAMNYRDLHLLNNWTVHMFNDTIKVLKLVNKELAEVREVALQNRYALDIILAAKGGVCALIHSHCCVYISNYHTNISATVKHMENMIKNNPLVSDGSGTIDIWGALWSWLPDGSWLRSLIPTVVMIIIVLVLLCCCIQCLPSLLQMCKNLIPSNRKEVLISETRSLLELEEKHLEKIEKEEMWE